ncbi:Odorant receptor 87 [Blattella germanica]|nr:Odorant receptor 87 [Blattella germanica]
MEGDLTYSRFKIIIFYMRLSGLPVFMERKTKIYLAYEILIELCGFSTFIASWLEVLLNTEDFNKFLTSVHQPIQFLIIAWIHLDMKFHVKTIESLLRFTEQFTWEQLPQRDPESGDITPTGVTLKLPKILNHSLIGALSFHFIQSIYRMLTKHEMSFVSWYPYDFMASPAYELTNLFQVFASIQYVAIFWLYVGLYSLSVSISCSQFYKVNLDLLKINAKQDFSTEELNNCIKHHQTILVYLDKIELAFNTSICGILLFQMTISCLCAFSITSGWGEYADLLQAIVLLAINMTGISILCWAGNKLTESAESVKEAVYSTDWVEATGSFKRSVLLMITRTNKQFTLTAAKFIPVNNETMMNIFKEIWTLILFLLEMKNKYVEAD